MTLVMTLLVRDVEDIVEANMRFHLDSGVDHIIVTDNLSQDGTRSIVDGFVRQGVATCIFEPADNYAQPHWVTRMARLAATQFGADWVINSDADEFWMPRDGRKLDAFFSQTTDHNIIEAGRLDFICLDTSAPADAALQFWQRMIYRKTVSLNPLGKPLPPKVAHTADPNVTVAFGNHSVSGIPEPCVAKGALDILHFPLRSRQQYFQKIRTGGRAIATNTELGKRGARTWREQYAELERTGTLQFVDQSIVDLTVLNQMLAAGDAVEDRRLCDRLLTLGLDRS